MSVPTPENPITLRIQYRKKGNAATIPALKNQRQAFVANGQLRFAKNKNVMQFNAYAQNLIESQLQESPFELPIVKPHRFGVWLRVVKYQVDHTKVPRSDLDNQYTTLQELLQGSIMEDDNQIASFYAEEQLSHVKDSQFALLYLWVDTEEPRFEQHMKFYNSVQPGKVTETVDILPELPEELGDL